MYFHGKGVQQNYEEAARQYRKAAFQDQGKRGENTVENLMGKKYYEGDGVEQNFEEAVRWYRKAEE